MVHSESEKYKTELFDIFRKKFEGRLDQSDLDFISGAFDRYIDEMVKLMRDGKSAHEKFFSDIIVNSIDAIIGFDNDSKVFLWNKGAETLFGWTKEEIQGKDFAILIPRKLLINGEKEYMLNEIKTKGYFANHETQRITKSGTIKNVSISRFVIFDDKGSSIGNVGIVRDITKEKQLEKELREKENLALIGQVVSSIAHNLSNPLNIISGNADYLLLDKKEADEGYEELKVIVDEATRITKSIRQILNFAKPLAPMREACNLNALLDEVAKKSKYLAGSKTIDIKTNLSKDIKYINIDKELFNDVFLNLINNAIQAIPPGVKGVIKITTRKKDNYIITEVSDNGDGISADDIGSIFRPFFTTKGYGKGTGLGLAFAERVVKEHDGKIEAVSKNEKGTTFRISLPQ